MKKLIIYLLISLSLLIAPVAASPETGDWEQHDNVTYYGSSGQKIKIAWDDPMDGGHAWLTSTLVEISMYNLEREYEVILATDLLAKDGIFEFACPKTGHWILKIRAKFLDSTDTWNYSDWATSVDPEFATVDGSARAWWLFTWIAKPGGIETSIHTPSMIYIPGGK